MLKRVAAFLLIMALWKFDSVAQVVTYANLSEKFIFQINAVKITGDNEMSFKKIVYLNIYQKNSKIVQKIKFTSGDLYDAFKSDSSARSYITGKNKNAEVDDCDFGDIVVADLNYDGKEDIAVKNNYTVDAGPTY